MHRPAAALLSLTIASCATTPPPPEPSPLQALLGCYVVTEVPPTPSSVTVGTRLCLAEDELAIITDERTWARMSFDWQGGAGPTFEGKHRGVELTLAVTVGAGGALTLVESGVPLGVAVRLGAEDQRRARADVAALPSVAELRARLASCTPAFREAFPTGPRLDAKDPATIHTTASFVALLNLAQEAFLRSCTPPPPSCEVVPLGPADRREELRAACAAKGTPVAP